jgi:hypothetical protein
MFGQYKRIRDEFTGVLTGKGLTYGGSLARTQATGYGLCYFTDNMLKKKGDSFVGKTVVISGSGNVATYACEKATQFGAKVVAMSDSNGYIYDANGINLDVISAYRTNTFQTNNFNNKVARVKAANPSLTPEEAENEAAKVVARPGTSEHQLGLAADILCQSRPWLDEGQAKTATQQWLMANCHKYGFILRYPKGTTDKTGIIYEPWHYRYVGVEIATEIMTRGITLEEYLGLVGAPEETTAVYE